MRGWFGAVLALALLGQGCASSNNCDHAADAGLPADSFTADIAISDTHDIFVAQDSEAAEVADVEAGQALLFEPSAVEVTQITGHTRDATVTVTNLSVRSVAILSVVVESKGPAGEMSWDGFYLYPESALQPGVVLGPNESHELRLCFAEVDIGEVDDTLIVTTDEPDGEYRVPLHGVATRCAPVPEEHSCAWTLEDDEWTCTYADCAIFCSVLDDSITEDCYAWSGGLEWGVTIRYLGGEGCIPPEAGMAVDFICTQHNWPDCPDREDPCQPPE